jgi:hypothetical protein
MKLQDMFREFLLGQEHERFSCSELSSLNDVSKWKCFILHIKGEAFLRYLFIGPKGTMKWSSNAILNKKKDAPSWLEGYIKFECYAKYPS